MDGSTFICISSHKDSVSSLVNHDQMEVSLLSQRSDVATPIRSITERHSLFPASFTRCPNSVPCGNACPEGRGIGLTLFRLNDTNDLVPTSTPAAFVSVYSILPVEHPAARLLARACQRLWLFGGYGAFGGSHLLDISFSLTLPPPWRWQRQRTPHGVLLVEKTEGCCLDSFRPGRYQPRRRR